MIALVLIGTLFALMFAFVRASLFCVPLMITLHFLHDFIPLVPQLGWVASWLVLFAASLVFFGGSTAQVKA